MSGGKPIGGGGGGGGGGGFPVGYYGEPGATPDPGGSLVGLGSAMWPLTTRRYTVASAAWFTLESPVTLLPFGTPSGFPINPIPIPFNRLRGIGVVMEFPFAGQETDLVQLRVAVRNDFDSSPTILYNDQMAAARWIPMVDDSGAYRQSPFFFFPCYGRQITLEGRVPSWTGPDNVTVDFKYWGLL